MVEKKSKKKAVNPTEQSETNRIALAGVSISTQEIQILETLSMKTSNDITFNELNYGLSFFIPHMVENVYQYNVKIEPKKSKEMRLFIFFEFVRNNFPEFNIAFDGVELAYAPQRLDTSHLQRKTKIIHPASKKEREFIVTIQEENDSEIPIKQAISNHLNSSEDAEPTRAVEAFETIVEADIKTYREEYRGVLISSSFFILPGGMYNFRTPCWYLQSLWSTFQIKKARKPSPRQIGSINLEEIITTSSSSAPNVEYIQGNLERMTRLEILEAAVKSLEFQEIAKKYFPPEHEKVFISEYYMKFDCWLRYMSIFGHLIKSIKWECKNKTQDEKYSEMIAKFCGKSLIKLEINEHDFRFNELSKFQVLEELSLQDVSLSEFGSVSSLSSLKNLELIRVKLMDFDWLSQKLPKVEHIKLLLWDTDGIKDDMLIEFQRQNPQLQNLFLKFQNCGSVTSSVLKDIGFRTPNIEKLICDFDSDDELEANTVHLSGLQKLKHLEICVSETLFSAKPLIDSLANKEVPIEYLNIIGIHADHVVENLPNLKRLKSVHIFECFEETLLNSITNMPNLEKIWVQNLKKATAPGICQILGSIRNANVALWIDELSIDSKEYSSILALAKDRHHKVTLYIQDAYIDVEDDVLEANRNWLYIESG